MKGLTGFNLDNLFLFYNLKYEKHLNCLHTLGRRNRMSGFHLSPVSPQTHKIITHIVPLLRGNSCKTDGFHKNQMAEVICVEGRTPVLFVMSPV